MSDGRLGKGGGRGLQASGVVQIHPQGQEQWWQEPSFRRAGGVNPVSGGQGTFGAIGRRMLVFFFFCLRLSEPQVRAHLKVGLLITINNYVITDN